MKEDKVCKEGKVCKARNARKECKVRKDVFFISLHSLRALRSLSSLLYWCGYNIETLAEKPDGVAGGKNELIFRWESSCQPGEVGTGNK